MPLTDHERRQLDDAGFLLLEHFIDRQTLAALRERVEGLFAAEGDRAGSEFKYEQGVLRLANLVDKGDVFREILQPSRVLDCVRHVLGPALKLSSLNARRVPAGSNVVQPLHADMGARADEHGYWVCNTVWLLDDFTPTNGTLRAIPGSHRWRKLPEESLADPKAPHRDEVLIIGPAGSVIVMNAHLWHGGTANRSSTSRTAVHVFFARRDKPQQQYQKQLVRPEVQQVLSPALRELLALDDPLNDQVSANPERRSGFLK